MAEAFGVAGHVLVTNPRRRQCALRNLRAITPPSPRKSIELLSKETLLGIARPALCTMGQEARGGARPTDPRSREACPLEMSMKSASRRTRVSPATQII